MNMNAVNCKKRPNTDEQDPSRLQKRPKPDSDDSLEELLDIPSDITHDALDARFQSIANAILFDYELVLDSSTAGETRYQVLEVEFYLWIESTHEDPFTHGSEEQRVSGKWSFHRSPLPSQDSRRNVTSPTGYRGGTRKGLDLTIGRRSLPSSPSAKDIRGGILLRTIRRNAPTSKVICGPSLIVDEILYASGNVPSISSLIETKWDRSADRNAFRSSPATGGASLTLVPRTDPNAARPTVYRSPRIGLDLSHPGTTPTRDHPRLQFLPKLYRFFIHPDQIDKGRPQTFLGVLRSYLPAFPDADAKLVVGEELAEVREKVMAKLGIKAGTFNRYFEEYATGMDKGVIRAYVGVLGKGAATSPASYLRMVGTLERFLAS